MGVAAVPSLVSYTAAAGQTIFPYGFKVNESGHIKVVLTPAAGSPQSTLLEGADYTVSGVGSDGGGNVTLTAPATAGDFYTIYRSIPIGRSTDFLFQAAFDPDTLDFDLDLLTMILQDLQRDAIVGAALPSDGPLGASLPAIVSGAKHRIPRINTAETAWELFGPLGSAALLDGGALAGQLLLLATDNQLPALDGSLLTNLPGPPDASTTVKGLIEIATQAEADAGTNALLAITPQTLAGYTNGIRRNAQEFTSNGVFTVPQGITTIYSTILGPGGGGAGGWNGVSPGGGGGAGSSGALVIAFPITVTPGQQITVTVPTGGAGGAPGGAGANASNTVVGALSVKGGKGGTSASGGGAGGASQGWGSEAGLTGGATNGGKGGNATHGDGGTGGTVGNAGGAGGGRGAGGGGGYANATPSNATAGGQGGGGYVLIVW